MRNRLNIVLNIFPCSENICQFNVGLLCLMPFSTIFQLHQGGQFYLWRKSDYPEKTTDMSQVTHKFHYIMLYREHTTISGFRTHNFCGYMYWLHCR